MVITPNSCFMRQPRRVKKIWYLYPPYAWHFEEIELLITLEGIFFGQECNEVLLIMF